MATHTLTRHEAAALIVAVALHAALVWWLAVLRPAPEPLPTPEAITVTLSDEVGLTSTSPTPDVAEPAAASAPELGETPPEPTPLERVEPSPIARVQPRPPERVSPRPPVKTPPPRVTPPNRSGAQRVDRDFLKGVSGASGDSPSALFPAAQIGANVRSSLVSAISRQVRPQWQGKVPQGADSEKLATILAFDLNPDGSLAGAPRVVRQDGLTDANRAQAPRHAEQAIRAVRLAAPFDLPAEYYNAWKRITSFRFDRKLSQ